MGRSKILIPKDELSRLYWEKKYSPRRIGKKYNCDAATVRARLKESGILLKSRSVARSRYAKRDFDGTDIERAYMLGFRLGDLNVYKPKYKNTEIIVVRCHSTIPAQIKVFASLFNKYGRVTRSITANGRNIHVNCYLNNTFSFLLPKYNQDTRTWLNGASEHWWAFIAGYVDAEGSFRLNQSRARFALTAYDVDILNDVYAFLVANGIDARYRLIARQGQYSAANGLWNKDLWRLNVNGAATLKGFIEQLMPYLRHNDRVRDAQAMLANIQTRRLNDQY